MKEHVRKGHRAQPLDGHLSCSVGGVGIKLFDFCLFSLAVMG